MLYEHAESGTYALRPIGEAWLNQTEDELSLMTFTNDIPKASLWKIERPTPVKSEAEPVVSSPLTRRRRILGRASKGS
jgi:hypothetical protein